MRPAHYPLLACAVAWCVLATTDIYAEAADGQRLLPPHISILLCTGLATVTIISALRVMLPLYGQPAQAQSDSAAAGKPAALDAAVAVGRELERRETNGHPLRTVVRQPQ